MDSMTILEFVTEQAEAWAGLSVAQKAAFVEVTCGVLKDNDVTVCALVCVLRWRCTFGDAHFCKAMAHLQQTAFADLVFLSAVSAGKKGFMKACHRTFSY